MADGRKPVIWDTDHVNTDQISADQAWRAFLRGNNPISMDGFKLWDNDFRPREGDLAMRDTRYYAEKVNLVMLRPTPHVEDCSTRFCLRNPGVEYLAYQPQEDRAFSLQLLAGNYAVEWFDVATHQIIASEPICVEAGSTSFSAPFSQAPAVLYLKALNG